MRDGGLNSGFMIAQVTAAALASENKSLAHPRSVDSLPTSANQEDHVSMATGAALRLLPMAANLRGHPGDRAAGRAPGDGVPPAAALLGAAGGGARAGAGRGGGLGRGSLHGAGHRGGRGAGGGRALRALRGRWLSSTGSGWTRISSPWTGGLAPLASSGRRPGRAGRAHRLGGSARRPARPRGGDVDCGGAWVLPGLVDCHTHLVFGGDRAAEFERRLAGRDLRGDRARGRRHPLHRAGHAGGEEDDAGARAPSPADALLAEGVTTVEIKSGYGLELETERRMLRAARAPGAEATVSVVTSLLAAHAVPPEYAGRQAELRRGTWRTDDLPAAAGLADAVDAFRDRIAFTAERDGDGLLARRRAAGLPVKLHADQLCDLGGAALAAQYGALSADHLEHASRRGWRAMAAAGTVAVLLPGATYFIREERASRTSPPCAPPGVRMALSTDMNPGSSPARRCC